MRSKRATWIYVSVTGAVMASTCLSTCSRGYAASIYESAVLADSPVAYYRLGETTGTVAHNSSDNDIVNPDTLDGAFTNFGSTSPASNIGDLGPRPGDASGANTIQGFETDNIGIRSAANSTAQVDVADQSSLDITGAITLEAWVKRNDTQVANANNEGIVGKFIGSGVVTDQRSYVLYYNSRLTGTGNQSLGFIINTTGTSGGNIDFNTGVNLPTGTAGGWTHLVAVFEPGVRMSVYMNGVSVGEKTTGLPGAGTWAGTAPLWIGRQFNASTSTSFEGLIDEVAVYNKALTPAQVLAHYEAAVVPEPTACVLAVLAMVATFSRRGGARARISDL